MKKFFSHMTDVPYTNWAVRTWMMPIFVGVVLYGVFVDYIILIGLVLGMIIRYVYDKYIC